MDIWRFRDSFRLAKLEAAWWPAGGAKGNNAVWVVRRGRQKFHAAKGERLTKRAIPQGVMAQLINRA
ncbi:MAG TPA: hypothetical protein PKD55_19555 [Bellilinea sp.]|nr:hypothetical protein [Bellilinea sp.]